MPAGLLNTMKRSLIIAPVVLALAVGGWYLSRDTGGSAPAPVGPGPDGEESEASQDPLPLLDQLRQVEASPSGERSQGVLNKPLLSLLARRASDGGALTGTKVTINLREAEDEDAAITVEMGSTEQETTELEAGAWLVTFEAEGYVPEAREVDLELGDEELLEVSLIRGARITGSAEDRFGQPLAGHKLFFLAPGQVHPRFPRDAEGILTTAIDRNGEIEPITIPPELYTITYGNLGTPRLKTEGRVNAGEDAELSIVYGGRSRVRFELSSVPDGERRLEVRLEELDEEKAARDQERLLKNPELAERVRAKGKSRERWRARGRVPLKDGVGEIRRAKPGVYRVTLVARPGEYSSEPIFTLEQDESYLVKIQTPALPAREGNRKGDPKLPREGPLEVTIIKDPQDPDMRDDGLYWR